MVVEGLSGSRSELTMERVDGKDHIINCFQEALDGRVLLFKGDCLCSDYDSCTCSPGQTTDTVDGHRLIFSVFEKTPQHHPSLDCV